MHNHFQTLTREGLDWDHVALRLWTKSKRLGIWDPTQFDFTTDAAHWQGLSASEKDLLLQLAALFIAGEEAVTAELLPLIYAIGRSGHLEEEMYLTAFLWEEAKHVEFFQRFRQKVTQDDLDLHALQGPAAVELFQHQLPAAMEALYTDASPVAIAEAATTYNMIVEGVLAETGYHLWYTVLKDQGLMPATVEGITHIQRDESRHIRYGLFLLSRLVAEHGPAVWEAIQARLTSLLPLATGILTESFERLERSHGSVAFDIQLAPFVEFAMGQFQKRYAALERAVHQPIETLVYGAD